MASPPSRGQEPDNSREETMVDMEAQPQPTVAEKNASDSTDPESGAEIQDASPVDWDGPDDPKNPRNYTIFKKAYITATLAMMVFTSGFASAVMSPSTEKMTGEFGISEEASILSTALYVLGFAFGPLLFGPASEVLGRRAPMIVGMALFAIFCIPIAVAPNVAAIFVCRFLDGVFGVAPIAIAGGSFADLYEPLSRGIAVAGFASATFSGPVVGPIVGGFVTMSHLGWRWTQWLTLIMAGFFLIVYILFVPETYSPVLLARKAKKLHRNAIDSTGDTQAGKKKFDFKYLARIYVLKPWIMIVQEPILALITLYMGFIYGFLYLCFEAYPIAFEQQRGWNLGVGALPFTAITVGVLAGVAIIIYHTKTRMQKMLKLKGETVPEERLIPMMIGSILMPVGMFWFAWTSNANITWVPQVMSGVFMGCGILLVFMQGLNYLIDVYKIYANSAIAINAMFRGLLGAGFPMFATYMFNNLGVPWAMSLLGFLCTALVPVPFLFYIYGARIRKWSKFTPY